MDGHLPVALIRDNGQAAAIMDRTRVRMLELLAEADSAAGVARQLGLPRQRVNYHLRELEQVGLVRLVGERRRGNCTERLLQATARSYVVSPEVLGVVAADPGRVEDRGSWGYLVAVASRTIRDVAVLRERVGAGEAAVRTITIEAEVRFASAQDRAAFAEDLAAAVAALVREYHVPGDGRGGEVHRLRFLGHPAAEGTSQP
jgi:DNA-binding transcriptional ArsR family regulator